MYCKGLEISLEISYSVIVVTPSVVYIVNCGGNAWTIISVRDR